VGFLDIGPPRQNASYVAAFRQGLAAAGFVEGRNVAIEYRWANNQGARLALLAAELVQRQVAVIVALGGAPGPCCKGCLVDNSDCFQHRR
jgi:putative ABC transport system substrate-binding protein